MKSFFKGALGTATCVAALAVSLPSFAQDADSATQDAGLDEIIVTAQKRAENSQDVAGTISVLTAEALQNRQIQDITDVASTVPSMQVGQLYGANQVTLRGISTGLTSGSEDASVAVHINGVYQPRSRSMDLVTQDLERVEVLAGPQGTLYGRNATGGVVNYILRGPSDEFEGEAGVLAANYDRYAINGSIAGPIADGVGFRLSALYDNQEQGFTENLLAGAPNDTLEARETQGVRGALRFEPSSNLTIDVNAMFTDQSSSTLFSAFGPSNDPGLGALLTPITFEPHKVYSEQDGSQEISSRLLSATVDWQMSPNVTLRSITAYQDFDDQMNIEGDGTGFPAVVVLQHTESETVTQELNLIVDSFDGRLNSIFGAFYYTEDLGIVAVVPFGIIAPPAINLLTFRNAMENESYAFFTNQVFHVTDQFRLNAGLRYNHDTKLDSVRNDFDGFVTCDAATEQSWDALTPSAGAQVDFSDHIMGYAQWSRGFKAGGFTANTCLDQFEPETIEGFEVGLKTELFDRRLRFNVAAYQYDMTDLQVQQAVGLGGFDVTNAAAEFAGAEASVTALLTENFTVDFAAAVQETKYVDFINCYGAAFLGACGDPLNLTPLVDVSGNPLSRAPPYTVNLGLEYTTNLASGASLVFRGESYWSGEVNYDEFESPALIQPAYSVQNAFVTYTSANGGYDVRAFVRNIGDEEYKVSGFFAPGTIPTGVWGAPRTFGAEVSVHF